MKLKIKIRGKEFILEDVEVCDSVLSQMRGLMFRGRGARTLLFKFKNVGRRAIHSFFCRRFIGIWLSGGRVVDVRLVEPWKISVKPSEEFDSLIEIPLENCNKDLRFIVENRKL